MQSICCCCWPRAWNKAKTLQRLLSLFHCKQLLRTYYFQVSFSWNDNFIGLLWNALEADFAAYMLTCLTGEGCDLHRLISSTFLPSVCQLPLLVLRSGTVYQMMSPPLHPCPPFGAVWRLTYSAAFTTLTNSVYCSDYSGPRGGVAA